MKYVLSVLLCVVFLCGCCNSHQKTADKKGVKVYVTDGSPFPAFLAGTWMQPGEIYRQFVFTPDGYLESAIIAMGMTQMYPFETTTKPLILGGQGVFVPGPWDVVYSPETRELSVLITTEFFRMQAEDQIIEGKMKEYFSGTVSEDGQRWDTQYVILPEYYVTTKELGKVTLEPGDNEIEESITFYKVQPETK